MISRFSSKMADAIALSRAATKGTAPPHVGAILWESGRPNMRSPNIQGPNGMRFESLEHRLMLAAEDPVLPPGTPEMLAESWSPDAWANDTSWIQQQYGLTGAGQTVAIIDSGIAYDHYALGGGFGSSYRVVGGWDFAENDSDPYDDAPGGFHGTHVAGIIGSSDPIYSGVAPEVDMVALRVFNDQGGSSFEWIEEALAWVHQYRDYFEHPITTVNLSLGSAASDVAAVDGTILEDDLAQLEADGIFVAVSAGNQFEGTLDVTYPASSSSVIPVASVGPTGELSPFSQRNQRVLAAPGEMITSTVPDYLFGFDGTTDDFLSVSGTSAAAPHVAAASVLVREAFEFAGDTAVTQDEIYQHLRETADEIYDVETNANYRRVNLARALQEAIPMDDHGDQAATATHLGTLDGTRVTSAGIHAVGDVDYFSVTPSIAGTLTINATSDDLGALEITGQGNTTLGSLAFDVVAGQLVSFGISSDVGIGHYSATATLVPREAEAVSAPLTSLRESHLSWIPSETGVYEIVLTFNHPSDVEEVVMYDGALTPIFSTSTPSHTEQFVVSVDQVQPHEVMVRGRETQIAFSASNIGASGSGVGAHPEDASTVISIAATNTDQAIKRLSQGTTWDAIRALAKSKLPRAYVEEALDLLFASMVHEGPLVATENEPLCDRHGAASVDVVLIPRDTSDCKEVNRNTADFDPVMPENVPWGSPTDSLAR